MRTCLLVSPPDPPAGAVLRTYSAGYGDLIDCDGTAVVRLPPIELVRSATALRNVGWHVRVVDLAVCCPREIRKCIYAGPYDVLVVSVALPSLVSDAHSARRLRQLCKAEVLLLRMTIADREIAQRALELSQADGIIVPSDEANLGALFESPRAAFTANLPARMADRNWPIENIPAPDRSLLDHRRYVFPPLDKAYPAGAVTSMHTSFGCPHPCAYYCPYPAAEGTQYRAYAPLRVVDEFVAAEALSMHKIVVRDPVFTQMRERTLEICERIVSRGVRTIWWCETRIDMTDPDLLKAMGSAGCTGVEVGVESGDPKIMRGLAKQGLTKEAVLRFDEAARAAGLRAVYLFILGLPGETRRSIVHTFELILELDIDADQFNLSVITPYPGTPFHSHALRRGWLREGVNFGGYQPVTRTGQLTIDQLQVALSYGQAVAVLQRGYRRDRRAYLRDRRRLMRDMEAWAA